MYTAPSWSLPELVSNTLSYCLTNFLSGLHTNQQYSEVASVGLRLESQPMTLGFMHLSQVETGE